MTEDEELQAKIAALSGRIKMHKQTAQFSKIRGGGGGEGSWTPQRGTPYGTPRGRGRYQPPPHRNRTLILNSSGSSPTEAVSGQTDTVAQAGDSKGWVTRRDRHNQLINTTVFEQKNQERIKAMEETAEKRRLERDARQKDRITKHFAAGQPPVSAGYEKSTILNHEVDVDNIRFRVTDGGSKLIRTNDNPNTARSTPKQTRIGGVLFLRSKNGNLYRSGLIKKKRDKPIKKKADLCPRFTTTGYCPHGPGCLFTHDAHKVAICKDFLQTGTCQAGDACDLSHDPTPNRVPACVHFLRGKCSNDNCRYAHIRVNPGAPVCRAFASLGYCESGISCSERHVHECPDYANKGICRKAKCPLPHVDRAGQLRKTAAAMQAQGEEHVVLPDFSSDEEYDQIGSDDVDSDDIEDHELSQQRDFVPF